MTRILVRLNKNI